MKICPKCGTQLEDSAGFCSRCGASFTAPTGNSAGAPYTPPTPPYSAPYAAPVMPYDHTAEFDPKDVSDNKVIAMLVYLLGVVGIIIALLLGDSSPYAAFHLRQALKFVVIETLTGLAAALLCWTIIVPAAAGIFMVVLWVVKIICFFQICSGKALEPPIIRSFGFLK